MTLDWKRIGWFCLGIAGGSTGHAKFSAYLGIAGFLISWYICRLKKEDF